MIDSSTVQPSTPVRRFAFHAMACILMAGVGLQSLFFPGLRIADRSHFHIGASSAQTGHSHDGDDDGEHSRGEYVRERGADAAVKVVQPHGRTHEHDGHGHPHEHPHAHPHSHSHVANHDHGEDRRDVVYVSADNPVSPFGQATHRIALDVEGLMLHRQPSLEGSLDDMRFPVLQVNFRTRHELPLERPPRARA